jgi:sporulation protein YlmC with PRC-barrel domain
MRWSELCIAVLASDGFEETGLINQQQREGDDMNQRNDRDPAFSERDRSMRDTASERDLDPSRYNEDRSGPGPRLMTASTLGGDSVVNSVGEDIGKIEEIMLDVPQGRIAYAVLSFGGFLGIGNRLFAIPWQALELDPVNHRFVLDVPCERLESAPGFDKDRWPDWADTSWAAGIHEYYDTHPYWE